MQEENAPSAEQLIKCQVCNRIMKTITHTHLKKHGMTNREYRLVYPGFSLGKCEWFESWRKSKANSEHLRKQAHKIINDPSLVEKRNHNRNVSMRSDSYRTNLSISMKAYAKTELGKLRLSNRPVTQRMKMSNFARWVEDFGYDLAIQKQLEWQRKNILPKSSRFTKIELLVAEALKSAGYGVVTQLSVPRYYCDIYLPKLNLIVEVNGDYWHANPSKYSADDVIGHKRAIARDIWEHDAKKIADLSAMGYNVTIVWESDIKNVPSCKLVEDIVRPFEKSQGLNEGNSFSFLGED